MENIVLFFKGIIIGIGKIIPGVSGSMLAISLGVYEKIFEAISSIFKKFKENSKFLLNIGLGIAVSIILMSKLIIFCLNKYYFLVMLLFIGLIVGGLFSIYKSVKEYINLKYIFILLFPFIFLFILNLIINTIDVKIKLNLLSSLVLGIIEAFTMIIPGISGTAIMMMLGIYEEQLRMFNDFEYFPYLIMFLIGLVITVIFFSKLIIILLNKYKVGFNYLILGFSLSSIIILFKSTLMTPFKNVELIFGVLLFIIGIILSYKLE